MAISKNSVFKVDKFSVSQASRDAFLMKLKETHRHLDQAEGCIQNHVLEQISGPGSFNIITIVEWRDEDAFEHAREASEKRHKASGFDRQNFMKDLGVRSDIGNYRIVPLD